MNKPPILPKDKTLTDILFEIDNSPCHNSKFIEINKRHMVEIGFMNDFDYEIFWGCTEARANARAYTGTDGCTFCRADGGPDNFSDC